MNRDATDSLETPSHARGMHASIPADRWCVSYQDLKFLRRDVKRALKQNSIQPTASDVFDVADRAHGPNMYSLNEQYIKPVTRDAGMMSWALMRNPQGLPCDLFISHAWEEAIFEFLLKVMDSWPTGLLHAWCCILANPQNLDIASLLQSPSESPFAVALHACDIVLVVPNRHRRSPQPHVSLF